MEANLNATSVRVSQFEKKLIMTKISEMNNLPALSANVTKVMTLLRDDNTKMELLVESLEKDLSLVAQILKLVNSGFYGLRNTVETVEHAVSLLGIMNLKQVVYSATIMDFFSKDEQQEWNHSYSSSILMSNIIRDNELEGINNLPLAMLMHDLGKVVLRKYSPKKYQLNVQKAKNDKIPVFEMENNVLGINHAEAGAILLEKWKCIDEIIKPVLYHHNVEVPPDFVFETALVQFVNWVDNKVRNVVCPPLSKELMVAAGIEEIDTDYWLNYQRHLADAIDNGRPFKNKARLRTGK